MKILRATIYGFGKLVDYTIDFSKNSATCIYGENESGKSTIQRFILFMLFGLPPRQRDFYRPKTSGKMGGRMSVDHPEAGEFIIERFDEVKNGAAICMTTDGEVHDEAWLEEKLNGMTAKTYQSIFSFSATDLTEIRNMRDEDLGEVLLGIGLTGSNSIYSIERRLEAKIGDLFKPAGKKPVINQQIETLKSISSSLQRFREVEQSYRDKKELMEQSERTLEELQQQLKDENAKAFSIEKQLHALPLIQEYHQLKERLSDYPPTILFPENGTERLQRWKETLLPLHSEWNVLKENERNYTEKVNAIKQNLYSETVQKDAEILLKDHIVVESQIQELKKIKRLMHDDKRRINEEIERLNIGIQPDELENMELPFYLENTWNQIRSDREQLSSEKEQLTVEEQQLKQERNYLRNQIEQLEDSLLKDHQIDELHNRVNTFQEYHLMEKLEQESENQIIKWEENKTAKKKRALSILTTSLIVAALAAFGALVTDTTWLFVIMSVAFVFGIGQWAMTNHSVTEMDNMFQTNSKQKPISVTEAEKMEAENLLERHNNTRSELTTIQQQDKLSATQFIKWDEKKKQLDERAKRLEKQIDLQYDNYPFLKKVEISFWPELFHNLNQLLKINRERHKAAKEADLLEERITVYHHRVDQFLKNADIDLADNNDENKLEFVRKMVKKQEEKLREYDHFCHLLEDLKNKQHELKQKMQTYEIEIKQLFEIAEVETEELFYYQARQYKEKSDLELALQKTVNQLSKIVPQESLRHYTEKAATEDELEMLRQQISTSIRTIEEQMEKERNKLAAVKAELAAMESSESYSDSLHQYEMENEQLRKLAKEWSVLKTAKEMLSETKRDYRDKYMTKVIEVTTKYFREITGNMYIHVNAPTDSNPFQVESYDNIRYTINELSQGTIDQLYVSLRLAISEIMSEDHGLPFIIDDAFVHFDATRTKRIIEILNQAANKQQVILFTCKEEIVNTASGMNRIDLTGELHA
ncbi:ATP-binding protein [Oceanobacillus saliphilus]|uniref:ATP-binding protein n=1 Tax=Oceanobacillus saliphilus TaxID=2925834 RepID=UPI00201D779C|nr:AAA family ATPase [Oceanobacillus saliphilus]